uniref:Uncharacterized protein n=1 Tax=Arundo donax TaxID=35708 RepID=A0A0A9ATL8_ARUDO
MGGCGRWRSRPRAPS